MPRILHGFSDGTQVILYAEGEKLLPTEVELYRFVDGEVIALRGKGIISDPVPNPGPDPDPPGDIAITIVATEAAVNHEGNVHSNTIDGDLSTRWSAEGAGRQIIWDLGSVQPAVGSLELSFYRSDERQTTFDIELSEDKVNWTQKLNQEVAPITEVEGEWQKFSWVAQAARYIRLTGYGNTINNWNSINECRVYSLGTTDKPGAPVITVTAGDALVDIRGNAGPGPQPDTYRIERAPALDGAVTGAFALVPGANGLEEINFRDLDVTNGQEYAYKVFAVNANGETASEIHFAAPDEETVPAPSDWEALFGTTAERLEWKARLEGKSYPNSGASTSGDFSDNKNDRARIKDMALSFDGSSSSAAIWTGTWTDDRSKLNAMRDGAHWMSTAAFYAYCMGDLNVAEECKDYILRAVRNSGARGRLALDGHGQDESQFSKAFGTHPWMEISPYGRMLARGASWVHFLGVFSTSEWAEVTEFINALGHVMKDHADSQMKSKANYNGTYWVATSGNAGINSGDLMWRNGEPSSQFSMSRFPNRFLTATGVIVEAGVLTDDWELINWWKGYARTAVRQYISPYGACDGDAHREFSSSHHEMGNRYGLNGYGHLISGADCLARIGDTDVFDFETTGGQGNCNGPLIPAAAFTGVTQRSILSGLASMCIYPEERVDRRGKTSSDRLDGLWEGSQRYGEWCFALPAYNFYRTRGFTGDYATCVEQIRKMGHFEGIKQLNGIPQSFPGNGRNSPWEGDQGTWPGMWLMFGDIPLEINPYPA